MLQDLKQYLVWDSEGISETRDTIIEDLFTAQEGSDSDEEKKPKGSKKKKREPSSSKGSEVGSESDGESSDQATPHRVRLLLCMFQEMASGFLLKFIFQLLKM